MPPDSHDGKDLEEILETYPREELFQTSVAELTPIALGVLRLARAQADQAVPAQGPVRPVHDLPDLPAAGPVEYKVRLRTQEILIKALNGVSADYFAMISESVLARLQVVVRAERGRPLPDVDAAETRAPGRGGRPVLGRRPARGSGARARPAARPRAGRRVRRRDTGDLQGGHVRRGRGGRPAPDHPAARVRRTGRGRALPEHRPPARRRGHRVGQRGRGPGCGDRGTAAVVAAEDLPDAHPDHAVAGAAAAAAHGRGGGGRAPVRVRAPESRTGSRSGSTTSACAAPPSRRRPSKKR